MFCSVVKLWDLRRTYTISRIVPPITWHSFAPTGDPERPFGWYIRTQAKYGATVSIPQCTYYIYLQVLHPLCQIPGRAPYLHLVQMTC